MNLTGAADRLDAAAPTAENGGVSKREMQYALGAALAVMLVTCIPYLAVWWTTPLDGIFPWVLFNSDDHGVYFAWMRQARDGHVLFRNLFTTEPQRGVYFHAYFLLLGWISRLPGLDIPLAYHLGRVVCGVVTLVLVYRLAAQLTANEFARRCAFWTTALSGGLGWLWWTDRPHPSYPVDVWQPEALTFPSLYTNGLFCVSLALMLGTVLCLLLAEERGSRYAIGAGLCGLALGNVHSYDVIHLTLAWSFYLAARWGLEGIFPAKAFRMALIAAVVAAPSVAYMAWLYLTEPVFKARADTATWSQLPTGYLLGYGLTLPLAFYAVRTRLCGPTPRRVWISSAVIGLALAALAVGLYVVPGAKLRPLVALIPTGVWVFAILRLRSDMSREGSTSERRVVVLLAAWAMAGLAAAYLPFAFQRKMVMGTHLPLALLAGLAVADLSTRFNFTKRAGMTAAVAIALLSMSSVRYLIRDLQVAYTEGTTSTRAHPVYWNAGEVHAWEWLGAHGGKNAALLTFPLRGVLAPSYSGHAVYSGHWGETPDFNGKLPQVNAFYSGGWTSEQRREFLQRNGITHVQVGPFEQMLIDRGTGIRLTSEPFLTPVFTEGGTTLYAVKPMP